MARTPRISRSIEYGHDTAHHENAEAEKKNFTFLIVIVSLLFVAVFGGALVGGVVSGDPSNAFFFTIIGASAFAIGVAVVVSIRYYVHGDDGEDVDDYGMETLEKDPKRTFRSEDEYDESGGDEEEYYDEDAYRQCYDNKTPVNARVKEVRAKHVPGDVSALSEADYSTRIGYSEDAHGHPARYHRNERGEKKGLFDFSSVASSRSSFPREDPPEELGCQSYEPQVQRSMDPSALQLTASATYEESEVGLNNPTDHMKKMNNISPANRSIESMSVTSRYDTPYEDDDESTMKDSAINQGSVTKSDNAQSEIETTIVDDVEARSEIEAKVVEKKRGRTSQLKSKIRSPSRSRSRSKSPGGKSADSSSIPSSRSKTRSDRKKDQQPPPPPPPPPRRRSEQPTAKTSNAKLVAPSPRAASEAGSATSSIFLRPFTGMFGKKRAASEAGYSESTDYVKGKGSETSGYNNINIKPKETQSEINTSNRPPMGTKRISFAQNNSNKRGLETIGGGKSDDKYTPTNSLAKKGIFSMPSPKPIPSTPGSESHRSMAESSAFSTGVASSTFNPQSRDRALKRIARNTHSLGATFNDMPIYYEDNDDDEAESNVAPSTALGSGGYDVFAPPGPIGMVVDTISKGCIVHSLKKTSPMQGLINPGDLIVALDDIDVRKMDAAALTKLMAKKSKQKERKFTLIPADDY